MFAKFCYLVSRPQSMHCADLVRRQSLAEEVDGRHLSAEHPLLIHIGGGADVALVKRLSKGREIQSAHTIVQTYLSFLIRATHIAGVD